MVKNKRNKIVISGILIITVILCSAGFVFADEPDYSQWDSGGHYPADVMGTKLLTPVKFLIDKKIITGYEDGLFHPDRSITRAEFATIMAKATNNLAELDNMKNLEIFDDLSGYDWAKPYINAVTRAELFKGRSESMFAPGECVTYAETITVLIRMNANASSLAEGMAPQWPDNYIAYAQIYNLMGPVVVQDWNAPATRGDVAQLLYRFLPKN